MGSSRKLQHRFKWALIITLCFLTFAILPSKSVGRMSYQNLKRGNSNSNDKGKEEMMKLVLGSKPPKCINRCMNCRPCIPVLVIPPHKKKSINVRQEFSSESLTPQEEETYYLLSWKCKCKDKLYQP